jgi:protein-S-isoprenylcysteine O-methyltransferase
LRLPLAGLLGLGWGVSEFLLAIFKRSGKGAAPADRGSLGLIWLVICASIFLAFQLDYWLPGCRFGPAPPFHVAGLGLFALGIALRWYAILHLGRFFTVNVAIAADHRLIESGPSRVVRHPSYTGSIAIIAGLGLCLCNSVSLAVLLIPALLVFLRRIRIEEDALIATFGQRYRDYMRRTKRLIPAIY